jgi:hypothetical protein
MRPVHCLMALFLLVTTPGLAQTEEQVNESSGATLTAPSPEFATWIPSMEPVTAANPLLFPSVLAPAHLANRAELPEPAPVSTVGGIGIGFGVVVVLALIVCVIMCNTEGSICSG